jgi:hypothetical protein
LKDVILTPESALPEPAETTLPLILHANESVLMAAIDPANAMDLNMVIATPFVLLNIPNTFVRPVQPNPILRQT